MQQQTEPTADRPPPTPPTDQPKFVINHQEMTDEMAKNAMEIARKALIACGMDEEKEIARSIKKEMDQKYGEDWQCVVGRNFGSYVTSAAGSYIYFYMDKTAVLLYKSG